MLRFFQSLIDQDNMPVVICTTDHRIAYLNPAACRHYETRGGASLLGKSLLDCHNPESVRRIEQILDWFREDPSHNCVHTFFNASRQKDGYMVALRDTDGTLIGYYEKQVIRIPDEMPLYEMGK